jgi:hypothetical protein
MPAVLPDWSSTTPMSVMHDTSWIIVMIKDIVDTGIIPFNKRNMFALTSGYCRIGHINIESSRWQGFYLFFQSVAGGRRADAV